jgi:hypothetical protein
MMRETRLVRIFLLWNLRELFQFPSIVDFFYF